MSNPSGLNSVLKSAISNNNSGGIGISNVGVSRPLSGLISNLDSMNNVLAK